MDIDCARSLMPLVCFETESCGKWGGVFPCGASSGVSSVFIRQQSHLEGFKQKAHVVRLIEVWVFLRSMVVRKMTKKSIPEHSPREFTGDSWTCCKSEIST
jgi:hypothetical protein